MNTLLSANAYVDDILQQPDALRATIAAFHESHFGEVRQLAERLATGALNSVVLTGMGSSYHVLRPLMLELIAHGIPAQSVEASELIHFSPNLLTPRTLVVAVSQSGQSIEMLRLLDLARGRGPLIGVTNTAESSLAAGSDAVLLTRAGREHSVSCKTYITALAALAILGDLLTGKDPGDLLPALEACADAMAQYLSHWDTLVESAQRTMNGISFLILAGRGPSLAAAQTGGLIIKEAAQFPAEGMSCAAFRHGPLELASPKMLALVYEGTGPTRQLNARLVQDVQEMGGRSELIAMDSGRTGLFSLPAVAERCLPLMEILPAQLTSVALAVLNNHSPGSFERAAKTTVVE